MFFMRDLNHWMGDSNRWLSASLLSSHGIRITWLKIRINQPQFPYWNLDSNLFMRDLNRLRQFELSRMWIRIVMWRIRIAFFSLNFLECGFELLCEGFESPFLVWTFLECGFESLYEWFESPSSNLLERLQNWRVDWGIRIALWGIRIWPLENSSKCSFVKIFLGIFIYILKHLLSLISKHNMSVLVSSKSTRVQQSPSFWWWQNTLLKD